MPVKDEYQEYVDEFPFVDGYLFQQFVFTKSPAEDFFKYAVFYAESSSTENTTSSFMLVTEVGKKADYSGLKTERIAGKEIHLGYIPSYKGLAEFKKESTASWQENDRILTVVLVGDGSLKDTVAKVLGSEPVGKIEKFKQELSYLFDKGRWLPEIDGLQLVTVVFWYTTISDGEDMHRIAHAQGNYLKDGDFLNVELRFGCSHEVSLKGIKLEGELIDKKIGAFSVKEGVMNDNQHLYYENEKYRFSVISHDNSQNKEKHSKELEHLLLAAIYLLEGS